MTDHGLSPHESPAGPDAGDLRVMRGGAWHDPAWPVRCSYRYRPGPW